MQIDPKHLMQLAAIVEAGGFTEAAARLGTTQPALSRTVALLEKRLGEPLFLRAKRPFTATAVGLALAEQGRAVLAAARKASERVEQFRQGEDGAIRIAGPPFFMDALVSGLVADFQSQYPRVRVDQSYAYTSDLVSMVRAAQIDMAFCPIDLLEPDEDIAFTPLIKARNVFACRAEHPLISKRRIGASDLLGYPWIAPPANSPLNADLKSALVSMGADTIRISYSCGSLAGLLNHLKRSDCLTVLPHSVVFAMRQEGEVSALPLVLQHPDRQIGILRSQAHAATPTSDRFAGFVSDRFDELKDLIRRHEKIVIWGR